MQHNQNSYEKAPKKIYNCVLCYTYNLCFCLDKTRHPMTLAYKTRHLMTLAYEFLLLDASLQLPESHFLPHDHEHVFPSNRHSLLLHNHLHGRAMGTKGGKRKEGISTHTKI
jgi:hypothetical protein